MLAVKLYSCPVSLQQSNCSVYTTYNLYVVSRPRPINAMLVIPMPLSKVAIANTPSLLITDFISFYCCSWTRNCQSRAPSSYLYGVRHTVVAPRSVRYDIHCRDIRRERVDTALLVQN